MFASALVRTMKSAAAQRLSPGQAQAALAPIWAARDQAIAEITARYVSHPWPINFLLIVDPLVTWIWVGAIITAMGGLIALWPVPVLARGRARARARARTAQAPVTPAREPA